MAGKATKARRRRAAGPYDRPAGGSMEVDQGAGSTSGRPLSAHAAKVAARKALQREVRDAKLARRKAKGGSKKETKAAKKALSRQIKQAQDQRASLKAQPPSQPAEAQAFTFDLGEVRPVELDPAFRQAAT